MYHIKSHCFYCGIRNANFDNFCLGVGVSVYVLAQVCFICVFVWGSELEHRVFSCFSLSYVPRPCLIYKKHIFLFQKK